MPIRKPLHKRLKQQTEPDAEQYGMSRYTKDVAHFIAHTDATMEHPETIGDVFSSDEVDIPPQLDTKLPSMVSQRFEYPAVQRGYTGENVRVLYQGWMGDGYLGTQELVEARGLSEESVGIMGVDSASHIIIQPRGVRYETIVRTNLASFHDKLFKEELDGMVLSGRQLISNLMAYINNIV